MSECQNCPNLGKFPFCRFSQSAREFLDAEAVTIEYPKGNSIFCQGDRAALYILCSGKVKLFTTSHDGRTAILRIAQPGDVLGISPFLRGANRHELTAEALERCRLQRFSRQSVVALLERFPDASLELARAFDRDYRSAYEDVRRIALPDSPAGRVARLLLDWSKENHVAPGAALIMPLTQEELASMAATTRETISRTFSSFRKQHLISVHGVAVTIHDRKALLDLCA